MPVQLRTEQMIYPTTLNYFIALALGRIPPMGLYPMRTLAGRVTTHFVKLHLKEDVK